MIATYPNIEGTIELYMKVMRAICGPTEGKSMVDIGCAFAPNTPRLGFEKRLYIDILDRKLDHPEEQQFFVQGDAWSILNSHAHFNRQKDFDVAIASDFIEHIHENEVWKMISVMEYVSKKQIIFVPIGEIFKLHNSGINDPEAHHSLWFPEKFPSNWYRIVYPDYHKVWNGGAFFAVHCERISDTEKDFQRVIKEINL